MTTFTGFDYEHRADPYPRYRALREATPLYRLPGGMALVTRYHDCSTALSETKWGRADANGFNPFAPEVPPEQLPFLFLDPPDHTRLRGLVAKAFTPRVIAGLRPLIESTVAELLDEARAAGELDLVESFAYPLPLRVICGLLGVPARDRPLFGGWSSALARGLDPGPLLSPSERDTRARAMRDGQAYFRDLLAKRRAEPADDLVSALAAVEEQGDVLTEPELLNTFALLLSGGFETTVSLIANGTLALLRNPGQLALWRDTPGLAPHAIEELARFEPSVQIAARVARGPLNLAGHAFDNGDGIVLLLASANRDPEVFEDPERLDLTRYTRPAPAHLSFAKGIHFCLGAALARLEVEIALDALVRRAPRLALAAGDLTYLPNISIRRMRALPVRLR
ncbi:cytochrome P450 [Amycolatopsis pithecellobii]|uniref:Cytochrome P450 n=1 Tax=Amycolatopsis pithecellobii TaxID=664692 RepID=A0A6N7Z8Q1_9PSEU|nr:cytochrome P450 [Amycolatopsis pithecellobii]MTD58244.1 cytochrome P450 [Amycolatopsis pithecellobii]